MKLQNKKTGEIIENVEVLKLVKMSTDETIGVSVTFIDKDGFYGRRAYNSLEDFNKEWEDYEEPKERWYIDEYGKVWKKDSQTRKDGFDNEPLFTFETREEAVEAVEKLKAWKRLKDKGFKFTDWNCPCRELEFAVDEEKFFKPSGEINEETRADLDLLFGGEG